MFLNKLKENNEKLLHYAFNLHHNGEILPDTYVLDLDAIKENASLMVKKANELNIELYYIKQIIAQNYRGDQNPKLQSHSTLTSHWILK